MANSHPDWFTHTLRHDVKALESQQELRLSIIYHPDWGRVGESIALASSSAGQAHLLSRLQPQFSSTHGLPRSLDDPYLSRSAISLQCHGSGQVLVERQQCPSMVTINGLLLQQNMVLEPEQVNSGVIILLAERIVLFLHNVVSENPFGADYGLIGGGRQLSMVREAIGKLAPLDVHVLLQGESGTGKELVARALHQASPRQDQAFVAVNAATITPSLAAAELFGARRGAYTGIERDRRGYLQQAGKGTLFLDEIGDLSSDVQVMLLRVLETRQIHAVGGGDTIPFEARLVTATDMNLEQAMAEQRFRPALYHRLSGMNIRLPALREQRQNFGLLLHHLLWQELNTLELDRNCLERRSANEPPWLPATWVAAMMMAPWPGNVRQLRNMARRMLLLGHSHHCLDQHYSIHQILEVADTVSLDKTDPAAHREPPAKQPKTRGNAAQRLRALSDAELEKILDEHQWRVLPVANALNVPRSSLYDRIAHSETLETRLARNRGQA